MGLDVYVGPLCRYYAGDWKLIAQRAAEAEGVEFRLVRPGGDPPPDAVTDSAEALEQILAWRAALQRSLGADLPLLDWDESPTADYFTDKPDWDGYFGLRLLAGTIEFPSVRQPKRVRREVREDPLFQHLEAAYLPRNRGGMLARLLRRGQPAEPPQRLRFPQLHLCQIWLPIEGNECFLAPDPAGNALVFGSVINLMRELDEINAESLRLSRSALEQAGRQGPPERDADLSDVAAYGLAIFANATRYGLERRLPMKLDY